MNIGDQVRNKNTQAVGIIADFMDTHHIVLVNLSDDKGVLFRWMRLEDLEKADKKCPRQI